MMFYQSDLEDLENLRTYKYHSEDRSLLAKFVLRHYWNWAIKFVPLSVAPNTITVIGGVSMLLSAFLTVSLDPLLCNPKTKFLHLANAILLLIYSTMDSIDGKQAIRTSSVSPLGQLMDHGVDSLASTLLILSLASSMSLGMGLEIILLLFLVYMPFYYATLYEKLTEKMVFGYINGPSEGIACCICVHLAAFFFSPRAFSCFRQQGLSSMVGLKVSNLTLIISIFYVIYSLYFLADIFRITGLKHLSTILTGFLVINGLFISSVTIANTAAFKSHIFAYLTISTIMLIFSYISVDLILARIKNSDVSPPPDPYFMFLFSFIFCFHDLNSFILESYIICLLVATSVSYVMRTYAMCTAISRFLSIKVFRIKT